MGQDLADDPLARACETSSLGSTPALRSYPNAAATPRVSSPAHVTPQSPSCVRGDERMIVPARCSQAQANGGKRPERANGSTWDLLSGCNLMLAELRHRSCACPTCPHPHPRSSQPAAPPARGTQHSHTMARWNSWHAHSLSCLCYPTASRPACLSRTRRSHSARRPQQQSDLPLGNSEGLAA